MVLFLELENKIETCLFIDEIDRYIKSSISETIKVDKLHFANGEVSFKERLGISIILLGLVHETISLFQLDFI